MPCHFQHSYFGGSRRIRGGTLLVKVERIYTKIDFCLKSGRKYLLKQFALLLHRLFQTHHVCQQFQAGQDFRKDG